MRDARWGDLSGKLLVHLASGIGNIVLATPLLLALSRHGYEVDVVVDGDYPDTAELLGEWSVVRIVLNGRTGESPVGPYDAVIPAIPPFYWHGYRARYANARRCLQRPPDALFYTDEQRYYLEFARQLGCDVEQPHYYFLPIPATDRQDVTGHTVVLAPGCKTGEMAAKRWPYFPQLAEALDDVVIVGTADDLRYADNTSIAFPKHARSLVGRLSLYETARVLASAGVVVANDSGLGHIAGATGAPTILLFGPTPDRALGALPPNVKVLRAELDCEPCWFRARLRACEGSVRCLRQIPVGRVVEELQNALGRPMVPVSAVGWAP